MEQLHFSLGEPEKKRKKRRAGAPVAPKDAGFSAAMRDARDILRWRVGPHVPEWRVHRLALALSSGR
jgi:hypothetical protein